MRSLSSDRHHDSLIQLIFEGSPLGADGGKAIGNRVELVGVVTKVHMASTKYGQPYCFVFFCHGLVGTALARLWPRFAQCSRNMPSMTRSSAGLISRECATVTE